MKLSTENNNCVKFKSKNKYHNLDKWRDVHRPDGSNYFRWILLLPSVLSFVCYINGLMGDFVHDDVFAIKNNPDVTGRTSLSKLMLNDFWGKPMSANTSHKSYRPITVLTFRWNFMISGLNPFYFHLVNVLLHVCNTWLFVFTCHSVFRLTHVCSLIAGCLFAVHPIHTEAVTGIVGRADLLAAFFFLVSIVLYCKSLDHGTCEFPAIQHPGMFCSSLLAAAVAMVCKETGITALGVCLFLDVGVVCRGGISRLLFFKTYPSGCGRLVNRILMISGWTLCLVSFRFWIMDGTLPVFLPQDNPASFHPSLITRFLSYNFLWTYNIWLLLAPARLCYDWQNSSIPLVESFTDVRNVASLGAALLLVLLLYRAASNIQSNSAPDPLYVSVVLLVIPFLPASNLFFRVGFVLAERILYIPSFGFSLCVAVGFERLVRHWRLNSSTVTVIFSLILVVHAAKTWSRNNVWGSRESLFRSGVSTVPHNSKAHYNYANFLKDAGDTFRARYHYQETLRLNNGYASAHNNLGTILENQTEAERHFREALRLIPTHQGAHINLGNLLFKRGDRDVGMRYLYRALELGPENTEALTCLAWSLMETRNFAQAERYLKSALDINPADVDACLAYGSLLSQIGKHRESALMYKQAYDLDSSQSVSLIHAAYAYNKLGDISQAETLLKRAMKIKRDGSVLEQLAILYYHSGRQRESLSLFEEAEKLSTNSSQRTVRFAAALASVGEYHRAEDALQGSLARDPYNIELLKTLALTFSNQHKHALAIDQLSVAIRAARDQGYEELAELYVDRANNYKDLKLYHQALQDYEECLALKPFDVSAHGNAGAIYHMNGDLQKARYHYRQVLIQDPNNEIVIDNLTKLSRLQAQRDRGIG